MEISERRNRLEKLVVLWHETGTDERMLLAELAGWSLRRPSRLLTTARALAELVELSEGQKVEMPVPPWYFGGEPAEAYLDGETTVEVENFAEIHEWLRGCEYASDLEVFGEEDHWAHPSTFEELRRGDCEDHAIWAWRQLADMGVPAWLMVGALDDGDEGAHVWMRFAHRGTVWVYESTDKESERPYLMTLRRAHEQGYRPYFSVDADGRTFVHREVFEPAIDEMRGWRGERVAPDPGVRCVEISAESAITSASEPTSPTRGSRCNVRFETTSSPQSRRLQ